MKNTRKTDNFGATVPLVATKRRHRSKLERRRIVEETLVVGASVAVIARAHGVNANQVFHWRKLYREGRLDEHKRAVEFLPATIIDSQGEGRPQSAAGQCSGTIDIQIGGVRVRITGSADPDCIRVALEQLQ